MSEETKDCTRLPVVAVLGDYPEIWLAPKCHDDSREWCQDDVWGECGELHDGGEPCAYQSVRYVHGRLLTDAQALLSQKDARIAQLAAHARGKNKALANALKEIERLKRTIEAGAENEIALVAERTELRAQLEQLQAAAERVVVLPERWQLPDLMMASYHEAVGRNQALDEVARLNPAPATADSDVREVKS